MKILDIVKPDLKDIRDELAATLRQRRKVDRELARLTLNRWKLGVALTEKALQDNLYHGAPLVGWKRT